MAKQINVALDADDAARLKLIAAVLGGTQRDIVVEAIRREVERRIGNASTAAVETLRSVAALQGINLDG